MRNNKVKLVMLIIVMFIIMPINGFLFTRYDSLWFPLLLMLSQVPFVLRTLIGWYRKIQDDPIQVDNLPGHRNPPRPRDQRIGDEL